MGTNKLRNSRRKNARMRLIYRKGYNRRFDAEVEFRHFKDHARADIERMKARIDGFAELAAYHGFYIDDKSTPETVQIWFGRRSMGRRTYEGKTAIEDGATLLYSMGPSGEVGTLLYPSTSSFGSMEESYLYVRIGPYKAHRLRRYLRRDLRNLVVYQYLSSIDTDTTWWQGKKMWWLRNVSARRVKDKDEPGLVDKWTQHGAKSIVSGVLAAGAKWATPIITAAIVGAYASDGIKGLVRLVTPFY